MHMLERPDVDLKEAIEDLRLAHISRFLDDREIALRQQSRVFFQISGAGHEALLLGVARSLRPGYDWFFPYYRDRALALALGVTPLEILLQAVGVGRRPGVRRPADAVPLGREGTEHRHARRRAPAASASPRSDARKRRATSAGGRSCRGATRTATKLTYVSLGEGATSEGEFWESLNTACRLHLPVLYVVADNGYAISVRSTDQAPAPVSEMVRGIRGLHVVTMDGRDYFEVRRKGADAIARVRAGAGPCLIHALVTRPYSHSLSDDQKKYRTKEELTDEAEHDPIIVLAAASRRCRRAHPGASRRDPRRSQGDGAGRGRAGARSRPARSLPRDACTSSAPRRSSTIRASRRSRPTPRWSPSAKRSACTLHEQMALDERIRVFGEDVADADPDVIDEVPGKGGVFGITFGLQRAFGDARCFNTPLAEANIIGRAVGQAVRGLRPCPEIQFFDYVWPAMNQIKSEAATTRWRSNGAFTCPMVVRIPIGGYLQGGAIWHSQCGESIFAHIPGLVDRVPVAGA